ncbi:MAG: M23 family metallopeptidase [Steroidobacteraceae bacterium]|jgi:murein DD-endopeptidase MepM/ murein hydrolase activator NlpD|nr:M23 family metallopeptidase [Steroidobacteraceae bacterium]
MRLDAAALLRRLPLDLNRPRLLMLAGLLLLGGGFALGALVGSTTAERQDAATLERWSAELAAQRQSVVAARQAVDDQVGALAARIGQMHARLIRLDALGKRLTEVANLDRGEFNFDDPPAVGGPGEGVEVAGALPSVPTLEDMLDAMGRSIEDRSRQLAALETLILSRELARQVVPGGRPVESGYISSFFGSRTDPFHGKAAFHAGLDFAGAPGTRVLAVADGVVSFAGRDGNYGKLVEVTHGNGYVTRYAHNSTLLVEAGQTVRKGDPIALMGSTGRSTGTHLHFEVLREGRPVNPLSFVGR